MQILIYDGRYPHFVQGVSKKSVILTFRFFGPSSDSIIKEICNAIINVTATGQLAIILAFVAL